MNDLTRIQRNMRTIGVLLLLSFLPVLNALAQLPEALNKDVIIEQDIQSQAQWNYKYKDGEPSDKGYKNAYKEFDRNGNVIKEEYYRRGDINQELSYEYDHNQNKTEYVNYSAKEDEIRFKQTIDYNNQGKKIREKRYNGSEHRIIDYQYNDKDKLARIIEEDLDGNLVQKRIFNYEGKDANIRVLNGQGKLTSRVINKYDEQGNLIEHKVFDPQGNRTKKISYEFNGDNLKTDEIKHQKGNFIYHKTYKYDKDNNLVEIHKEQPRNEVHTSRIYKYTEEGYLKKELWYDSRAEKYSHKKYTYNEEGIVQRAKVYYALYDYRVLYRYKYNFH